MLNFLIIVILMSVQTSISKKMLTKIIRTNNVREQGDYVTNFWAVRIEGGAREAEKVAKRLKFNFLKNISEGIPKIFLFRNPKQPIRTNYTDELIIKRLLNQPEISWAEQQVAESKELRRHVKKTIEPKTSRSKLSWDHPRDALVCPHMRHSNVIWMSGLNLNDKFWPKQTYLRDCHEYQNYEGPPRDINLMPVWVKHGFFGKGIKVLVVDTGIEKKHLDLVDNYDPSLGIDLVGDDKDPEPAHYWWYPKFVHSMLSHGTNCAGIIGMKANNTICGVGIAPSVTLGAVRLLGLNALIDYKVATAFLFRHTDVHVSSNSWGPQDSGKIMPYMGPLTRAALKIGITKGRGGKGVIYVFSAGNGKRVGDNCGCDKYVSSIFTIAVATCDFRGKLTSFSEQCPSIMVTTYAGRVATDIGGDKCITDFNGTSASAPVVSGAIALALEANPNLSWRDIQHLLAWTCQVAPLQQNPEGTWMKNGAGFYVSHDFGFGMLNVSELVEMAKGFKSVGPMNTCVTRAIFNEKSGNTGETFSHRVQVEINSDGCEGTPSEVAYLEHVQLTVTLGFPRRGELKISLTSPSGTRVKMLNQRPLDLANNGLQHWSFDSVMTWGESPKGKWIVLFTGKKRKDANPSRFKSSVRKFWSTKSSSTRNTHTPIYYPDDDYAIDFSVHIGELEDLTLTFYGTSRSNMPEHYKTGPRTYHEFNLGNALLKP